MKSIPEPLFGPNTSRLVADPAFTVRDPDPPTIVSFVVLLPLTLTALMPANTRAPLVFAVAEYDPPPRPKAIVSPDPPVPTMFSVLFEPNTKALVPPVDTVRLPMPEEIVLLE